ncbi:hypothetical protein Uis1B_2180 [Bifidobacterium margollesii]|uniref:Amidoligase enzyme n=1 Tax=Bifidobacterium margollesii TaxID=2020964 RepID=A0A2N5J713_9BIFI|nr:hypothetical protein [Bifidobacterium margollesii]PLS29998.1 hypothetical protein Uis1B_2180 [Bifidobacterium margollesii]
MNDTNDTNDTRLIPCDVCGTEQTPDRLVECDNPYCNHHHVCPGCHGQCGECSNDVCDDCSYECESCGYRLCPDCRYACEDCGWVLCGECGYTDDEGVYRCVTCHREHADDRREPLYRGPYDGKPWEHAAYTYGIEIEIDGDHSREPLKTSPLIAGWCPDGSLESEGLEYQTQPLSWNRQTLEAINRLVASIPEHGGNAGGHIHIRRTARQTPARWYWALTGLNPQQAKALNMRHTDDARWCHLTHGDYTGKATAVNDQHRNTIELRTFGRWNRNTAQKLTPALTWLHTMWRFLQHHPVHSLKTQDIQRMSQTAARNAIPRPEGPAAEHRRRATAARRIIDTATEHAKEEACA